MKKIFMAIALCLMCAVNVFGEDCKFQKINSTDEITDGEYIICYETSTEIKIFQQFGESAVSVKKQNDSVVVCDDLLAWDFECIIWDGDNYEILEEAGVYEDISADRYDETTDEYVKIFSREEQWEIAKGRLISFLLGNAVSYGDRDEYYHIFVEDPNYDDIEIDIKFIPYSGYGDCSLSELKKLYNKKYPVVL